MKVDGIELSPAMVARLRAKPGGDSIPVTIGDFADVAVPDSYRLVFVVFNTFFNLLTQDAQVLDESHVSLSKAGVRVVPIVSRYAWPSELDR